MCHILGHPTSFEDFDLEGDFALPLSQKLPLGEPIWSSLAQNARHAAARDPLWAKWSSRCGLVPTLDPGLASAARRHCHHRFRLRGVALSEWCVRMLHTFGTWWCSRCGAALTLG